MPKALAIDYGLSRVGLAMSDPMGLLAKPYKTIRFDGDENLAKEIAMICEAEGIDIVVIGNPVHFSGDDSDISALVRQFASLLEDMTTARIVIFDERLTTKRAKQIMHEQGEEPSRDKDRLNAIAAAVVLTDYLAKIS